MERILTSLEHDRVKLSAYADDENLIVYGVRIPDGQEFFMTEMELSDLFDLKGMFQVLKEHAEAHVKE